MDDLDLSSPGGTLNASAENAAQYRFLLLKGTSSLTAQALAEKPDQGGADLIFDTGWFGDAGGKAEYALAEADVKAIGKKLADEEKPELKMIILGVGSSGEAKPKGVECGKLKVKHAKARILSTKLTARGGTPLMNQQVEVVDPDTGKAVGPPVETNEKGELVTEVPEDKPYHIRILDDDEPDPIPSPLETSTVDESTEERVLLSVKLLDAAGKPVAEEAFEAKGEKGSFSGKTDRAGVLDVDGVEPGPYTLKVRGKELKAHTLYSTDLEQDAEPYLLVVR